VVEDMLPETSSYGVRALQPGRLPRRIEPGTLAKCSGARSPEPVWMGNGLRGRASFDGQLKRWASQ